MQPAPSAGKRMRARHDWFWFCFSLVEKSGASFVNQSQSAIKQNQSKREITFDTQVKTALFGTSQTLKEKNSLPFVSDGVCSTSPHNAFIISGTIVW